MLITISGMVGSGKSTASKYVIELLEAAGVECRYVRFRSLGLLGFRGNPPPTSADPPHATGLRGPRRHGFHLRKLTTLIACGYAARMIAFRLFGATASSRSCCVIDRYFYDNFVHYKLQTRTERAYLAALQRLMPVPDVAILLMASAETIRQRRPGYAAEYISVAGRGYEGLPARFPELVALRTDAGARDLEALQSLVHDALAKFGLAAR